MRTLDRILLGQWNVHGDNMTWIRAIPLTFTLLFTLSSLTQILLLFLSSTTSYSPISLSLPLCSASVLLWGIHWVRILQRHSVPDRLWRPLFEVDRVSRLRHAVPGTRPGRPQLLQEPRPRVQPVVFLQTELRSHWMGVLWLPPGYDHRNNSFKFSRTYTVRVWSTEVLTHRHR